MNPESANNETLTLLIKVQRILESILISQEPPIDRLIAIQTFWSARHVCDAADSFICLYQNGKVTGSKLIVRCIVEDVLWIAVTEGNEELLYRKAFTEMEGEKKLFRSTMFHKETSVVEGLFSQAVSDLRATFLSENPGLVLEDKTLNLCTGLEISGKKSGHDMKPAYDWIYRHYCQYTHGTLRAITQELGTMIPSNDCWVVLKCVYAALNAIRRNTRLQIPDLTDVEREIEMCKL
jgi:hypothetical protein